MANGREPKKLERLKSFVAFCLTREWITRDITRDLRAPEGSSTPANKTPFTDEELKRIYDACDVIGGDPRRLALVIVDGAAKM